MAEKQSGLANAKKWSAEVQKLQQYIQEDMTKAETAVENLDGETEEDLEAVSEINQEMTEQTELDEMIGEEAEKTVEASQDLSSEEIAALNTIDEKLGETTAKVKGKAKKEVLETAGKLVAKGKSVKEVKEVKEKAKPEKKAVEKKEVKTEKKAVEKKEPKNEKAPKTETKNSGDDKSSNKGGKGKK